MAWLDLPLQALSRSLTELIRLDPEGWPRLERLQGRCLVIELQDTGIRLLLRFDNDGLHLSALEDPELRPDACIQGRPFDLLVLARDPEGGGKAVHFTGDLGLVRDVRTLFARLDVDWEEQLSGLLGDVPAHQLGRLARGSWQQFNEARHTLERNLGEYLTEEQRLLPSPPEVDIYLSAIDRLREDTDRLEARIRRLERQRQAGS
ncbi:MAG: SCP2 sterol-binding domain-containing protein [Ectothiorhodospiraceae bacterium]|nr:SCP2 sterol-binding domain-containing protein [Ectothiorhodospiraceae bacterium]